MRRWLRRILIGVSVLLVIGVAVYTYIFHLGGVESYVIGKINDALGDQSSITVSVGRIKGDFFTGLELEGVAVDYADTIRSFTLVSVAQVSAQYSFADIWNRTFEFESIFLDGVEVTLARGDEGRWLLPLPGLPQGGEGSTLSFAVRQLGIDNARIRVDRADDTLWISDLKLSASLKSEGRTHSLDIGRLAFASSDSALSLDALTGKATLADGRLFFQDLSLQRGDTHIKLSGTADLAEPSGTVAFAADGLDLGHVWALTGVKLRGLVDLNGSAAFSDRGVEGQASIGGNLHFASLENLFVDFRFTDNRLTLDTLYGTILENCAIDGSGEIDFSGKPELYRLDADVRNFNLKQIATGSFVTDLTGRIEMLGESFSKEGMLLELDVDLYESSFDEYPLQRASGPIQVTTKSVRFPTTFQIDYFENKFYTVGAIDYRGDMRLEIEADLANLDRYQRKLFIDQPGGRGRARATLSGRTADPDLSGWFASDSLWIYGLYADSCYSTFDIDRFLRGREGSVELDLISGAAWQVPYDTGYAMIGLDSQLVTVDTMGFRSRYAGLAAEWRLDQGTSPWLLTIDSLSLSILERQFFNRSHMVVEIDSLGFDFRNTAIGKDVQSIVANHRINFDETMNLTLEADDIPVAPWLNLFEQDLDFDAVLSGSAELAGSFENPVFNVAGSLDTLVFRDTTLGDLSGSVRYRDRLLTVDSLVVLSDSGVYRADGEFYANLSFGNNVEERLPDLPFDLKVTASDSDFDLVYLFLPSVEQLRGNFNADIRLTGTPSNLHLDGQAFLKNGRLKYFDLVDTIRTDSAGIHMIDTMIVIDGIRTYVEDKKNDRRAYADISGALIVKTFNSLYYDIMIDIPEELPFKYDLDDIEGVVQGQLEIVGDAPPAVTGDLVLASGKYQVEFADDETGSPLILALSGENTWDLNIKIEIPSNYRIRNEDIDAEFGGFLNIIREDGQYRFIGELDILRGKGYLFDKTFTIIPDSARVIFEDIEYPDPRLDVWARSRIPVSRTDDPERSYHDLKVHVTGTLDNPEFGFFLEGKSGDAPLSYEAIVPLIVANAYGSESTGGAFEERISQLVSTRVSQIGTRRIGVETFEIDPTYEGYLDLARTRFTLGHHTSSNLYLWWRQDVGFGQRPEAGFEYRFSKALLFEGFRDEDIDKGERYHLNLKLHWEF